MAEADRSRVFGTELFSAFQPSNHLAEEAGSKTTSMARSAFRAVTAAWRRAFSKT
jgi:hypothetical protein